MPHATEKIMDLSALMRFISEQRAKGISDYQIVQSLISNGYSSSQVYDALTQLDLKQSMKNPPSGDATQQNQAVQEQQRTMQQSSSDVQLQQTTSQSEPETNIENTRERITQETIETTQDNTSKLNADLIEKVQEISETIIEEKWDELIENVKKIVEWKNRMEERINKISERTNALEKEMSNLKNSIFSKIKEYDNHIVDFDTDLKALQKVFGDMLPEFVSSIHQLKDIVDNAKESKKQ